MTTEQRRFWRIADNVKRRLFNKLRDATQSVNYLDYQEYQHAFEEIPGSLIDEWQKIREQFRGDPDFKPRLKGYLLEALFYYSCLKSQALFMDAELAEMGGTRFERHPPWLEATPLYDIIPALHNVKQGQVRKTKVPQTKADFFVTYVDDNGPSDFALVDVKSKIPSRWDAKWGWQIPAAMRRGFVFQIAYPKDGMKYPKELKDWEVVTPCSKCKKLSRNHRTCANCGEEIYPFTITDAYYKVK